MSIPNVALVSAMCHLLQDTDTADFTVVCGMKEWQLHSLILATRSPFFKAAINNDTKERKEKRIEIHDLDSTAMQQVINYMYGVNIEEGPFKTLVNILEASVRFQMDDLKKHVVSMAKGSISEENVIELGLVSELYNIDELLQDCVDFIVEHDVKIEEELTPKFANNALTSMQNAFLKSKRKLKGYTDKNYIRVTAEGYIDVHFNVKKTTKMWKLKQACSDHTGVRKCDLRFLFGGRRILDDDTPEDLEMKNNDVIQVSRWTIEGFRVSNPLSA